MKIFHKIKIHRLDIMNFTFIGKLRLLVIFIGLTFSISCKKEKSCSDCESNKPPVANAGPNQAITLPTDSVSLNGGASYDPDGTISEWNWSKISGPSNITFNNAMAVITVVKNFTAGIYLFELNVTDNSGLTAKDTVQIIVVDQTQPNVAPVANAGADQVITLPIDSVALDGSASYDLNNNISTYQWTKLSGPSTYTIIEADSVQTLVKNLLEGTYSFELLVTDSGGLFSKDTVQIIVNPAISVNQPPVSNAGNDQTINLPIDSVFLDGSGSTDPDNNINSYLWKKISGPSTFTIVNPNSVQTKVINLIQGIYKFELKVTDSGGLFSNDTVQIIVNPATSTNHPPVANAGQDQSITLPLNLVHLDGGSSTDPENNISAYLWKKISGPYSFYIQNPQSVQTIVHNLLEGVYAFELKVTDAGGLVDTDTLKVTVSPIPQNSHWSVLASPPGFGTETFIFSSDANNVFSGEGYYHHFWQYNIQNNSWVPKENVPGQAYDYLVNFGVNGKGYVGMGFEVNTPHSEMYQYDPITNQWVQKNNSPLSGIVTSVVINNLVYLLKGQNVWMYNPVTDSYTQKNNFPITLNPFDCNSFVINGTGYCLANTGCWEYQTATDSWQQKASLPNYLSVKASFALNSYGYILADSSNSTYSMGYPLHLWRYDPNQNLWQRIHDDYPGSGAYSIKSASLGGIVYVGFGYNNGDFPDGSFWKFE